MEQITAVVRRTVGGIGLSRIWNIWACLKTMYTLGIIFLSIGIYPGGPGLAGTRMSLFCILLELRMTKSRLLIYRPDVAQTISWRQWSIDYSSHNKILRILQNAPRETHVADLYITFNRLTLPNLHKFHILLFMHKFVHHKELLPNIFSSYFTKNSDLHTYNTRSKTKYISNYLLPLWGNVL